MAAAPSLQHISAILLLIVGTSVAAGSARPAYGDPIELPPTTLHVTSGFVEVLPGSPFAGLAQVALAGSDGMELSARGIVPSAPCFSGCAPGSQVNFFGPVYLETGTLSYQGETHPFSIFSDPVGLGELWFDAGVFTLPQQASSHVEFKTPFSLTFSHFFVPGFHPMAFFKLDSLNGTVTGRFTPQPDGAFQLETVRYEVTSSATPVPEPSSLLLVGAGLTAFLAGRRKRRSS